MLSEPIEREMIAPKAVDRAAVSLTPTEEKLRDIWREVFANPGIGADDDFYELDGYSLLAARIALRVREMFGVELPLDEIYRTPTVREVAAYMDRHIASTTKMVLDSTSLVLFKAGSGGLPLFFIHGPYGGSAHYLVLAQHLKIDRPLYGIDSPDLKSDSPPQRSLPQMAAFGIGEMRKVQPQGPYFLIGHSWSGLLAFEMAQQLRAAGEEVALLAILDSAWRYNPAALPPLRFLQLHFGIPVRRFLWRALGALRFRLRRIKALLRGEIAPVKSQPVTSQSAPAKSRKPHIPTEDELLGNNKLEMVRRATQKYHPHPYAGRITYFLGQKGPIPLLGRYQPQAWTFLARGGIDMYKLPSTHGSMMVEPLIAATAEVLAECIRKAAT